MDLEQRLLEISNKYDEIWNNMNAEEDQDVLAHYGTPRHSGRYPWGSGEHPYQHSGDFLARYEEMRKSGMSETEIADWFGIKTPKLRAQHDLAVAERRADLVASVKAMKSDGYNRVEIAAKLGLKGESSVRSLEDEEAEQRMNVAVKTADMLAKLIDEKGPIDVGKGVETELGISKEKLNAALEILQFEGYVVLGGRVPEATNAGRMITIKAIAPPGTPAKEVYNYGNIHRVTEYTSRDNGKTLEPSFRYPSSLNSDRLAIRYADEGGIEKDGLVEIRRGVKDLSLGNSNYAQVRILVDGTHYIKGMAVYSDNLPPGKDILFNTNKPTGTKLKGVGGEKSVLKEIKSGDNPFGSAIKEHGGQSYYDDPNGEFTDPVTGNKQSLSLINKRSDEGDWLKWSKTLPSQFLSKQPIQTIKKQVGIAVADTEDDFNEIMNLTNSVVKKQLLADFADSCDAAAVELSAASYPNQRYHVLMPIPSLKDGECYAPLYPDGAELALVRFPHGGIFEIAKVKNNIRNKEGKEMLTPSAKDVMGINQKTASKLSGADFDGDTVIVIPQSAKVKTISKDALPGLEGFDPSLSYECEVKVIDGKKHLYRNGREVKPMTHQTTQTQMGIISNLITDMTLKGAPDDEIAAAVRHSMVVIDAEKHNYDYRQSEKDNNIRYLQKKWQTHYDEKGNLKESGAASLISLAGAPYTIPERKEGAFFTRNGDKPVTLIDTERDLYRDDKTGEVYSKSQVKTKYVDEKTGKKLYHETGRTYLVVRGRDEDGKLKNFNGIEKDGVVYYRKGKDQPYIPVTDEKVIRKPATQESTRMAEVDDARLLSTGNPKEEVYAEYANKMKSLANEARKQIYLVQDQPRSPSAAKIYSDEVDSLKYKLDQSKLNAPKERQAQYMAAIAIKSIKQDNPNMTHEQLGKVSQQELQKARTKAGAQRQTVTFTDREWEAIQANAISPSMLKEIIKAADSKVLRQLATPKQSIGISETKINRIKNYYAAGYTTAEIAEQLGLPTSTVLYYTKKES